MINKIHIKDVATYSTEGALFEELKEVNFIYGANGTGKTTISRLINNSELSEFSSCTLNWKDNIELNTLVYNKQFRSENFSNGDIAGVFTLGQATAEEIELIESKKEQYKVLFDKGVQTKRTEEKQVEVKEQLINEFRENIWTTIYKRYEDDFKEAFKGSLTKVRFLARLLEEYESNSGTLSSEDELVERSKVIFGKPPVRIEPLTVIEGSILCEIENDQIWQKKIIGKSDIEISKLIQVLGINDWVYEGKSYVTDESETCPFCQQETLTPDFKSQLDSYFDESFKTDTGKIKELSRNYLDTASNVLNTLNILEAGEKENPNSKLNIEVFSAMLKTLSSHFVANKEILLNKEQEPSRSVNLVLIKNQIKKIIELLTNTNIVIAEHNRIVTNFQAEKSKLINDIWCLLIEENRPIISTFIGKSTGLQTGIENLKSKRSEIRTSCRELDTEIKLLTKNVTSIQPTIDEINQTLNSFGFNNFKIVPASTANHYQIQREDGTLAESTLSEGEITFITFLYFLQLSKGAKDEASITDSRVLVIDDPISSLDSNILFVVSSLIKEIARKVRAGEGDIKQLIILTHNVYFHKEVSFIDGRTTALSNTRYWILRKNSNISTVQSYLTKNPIKNSYDLLWQELNNVNTTSTLSIQNTMRRIIEHYFKLLGKYGDDDLISKFQTGEEQEICRSLICWINDGSHTIPDDLYIEQHDDTKAKYLHVFKQIFIEMDQIGHYDMMMRNSLEEENQ